MHGCEILWDDGQEKLGGMFYRHRSWSVVSRVVGERETDDTVTDEIWSCHQFDFIRSNESTLDADVAGENGWDTVSLVGARMKKITNAVVGGEDRRFSER